ncbi:MAG: DinB family protein [Chloroflexi bacterium]|nr:DinB family protein [Chloroflexota bacterium]
MDAAYFRALFDYQYWARDRLLAAVGQLAEADCLAPRPMDYGSIHGTLVHAYAADVIWHSRWQGVSPTSMLSPRDVPSLDALVARWNEHEQVVRAFVEGLSDEDVTTRVLDYRNTEGKAWSRLLWQTMAHLINHGTNHRSEVAAAATLLGHSPGDLDMIVYFNTR